MKTLLLVSALWITQPDGTDVHMTRTPDIYPLMKSSPIADVLPQPTHIKIQCLITRMATSEGITPDEVYRIIYVESRGQAHVISHKNAIGLMQVTQAAAYDIVGRWLSVQELQNPFLNIYIGIKYYAMLKQKYEDKYLALLAYNMGMKNVNDRLHYIQPAQYKYIQLFNNAKPERIQWMV